MGQGMASGINHRAERGIWRGVGKAECVSDDSRECRRRQPPIRREQAERGAQHSVKEENVAS